MIGELADVQALRRAALVGLDHPYSPTPRAQLYPYAFGATGYRLVEMVRSGGYDITIGGYFRGFLRLAYLHQGPWTLARAQAGAKDLRHAMLAGRPVVLIGADAAAAFGISSDWCQWTRDGDTWFACIPHPQSMAGDAINTFLAGVAKASIECRESWDLFGKVDAEQRE